MAAQITNNNKQQVTEEIKQNALNVLKAALLEQYVKMFESETMEEFELKIEGEINELVEALEVVEDKKDIKVLEDEIDYLREKPLYKGIVSYNDLRELKAAYKKQGREMQDVFSLTAFNKANLEEIKELFIEEWAEDNEEIAEIEAITTMKAMRGFLKEHYLLDGDYIIWNKQLVSALTC